MTWPSDLRGLTAADVMHRHLTTLSADATVGEVRDYFATSTSRQLVLLTDGARYAGSIAASALPGDAQAGARAGDLATRDPTIAPHAPATRAREMGLEEPSLRVPVVDDESGVLLGIVAINRRRDGFCGAPEHPEAPERGIQG